MWWRSSGLISGVLPLPFLPDAADFLVAVLVAVDLLAVAGFVFTALSAADGFVVLGDAILVPFVKDFNIADDESGNFQSG
jgi:hypothetical protein